MKPVCFITGAGGLLGNALCVAFSKDYNVVATYKRSIPKHSSQLIKQLSFSERNDIYCIQGDLMKKADLKRIVDVAIAKFGQIDVLINNAVDYTIRGPLLELCQADDYAIPIFTMNSIVPFELVSYIHESCWKFSSEENLTWNRSVLNISSISALDVYPTSGAFYSASKSALNMLTLHLSVELKNYAVRANAFCPGSFHNDGVNYVVAKVRELIEGSESGKVITNLY
jgi:NAD(P)-dependent dehydrogenase (short-subunit alcohol dehydrogenase family)